ncbi:MAG: hypothetical protein PF588_00145 [Candidatus Kapabacteria bacterium]|nr:hypothetical protein [Candidatus Kapabacteria bacterium]
MKSQQAALAVCNRGGKAPLSELFVIHLRAAKNFRRGKPLWLPGEI